MKTKFSSAVVLAIFLLGGVVLPVLADGIIIPEPPPCREFDCPPFPRPLSQLEIKYHHVDVVIEDQVAETHVDQIFYNPNDWAMEGTYIFPLPMDAVVSNFTMWVDGEPVDGKVLSAEEARRIYEEIVMQQRDPALLEYVGRGAVQASIFPIPPKGERRIELRYTQMLPVVDGLVRYIYPLNTEKFSMTPLESVKVSVEIRSSQPVRAVYSPSHSISIERSDDGRVKASYEANQVTPDSDFSLLYSVGDTEAFHLLSYRDPGDKENKDGFFLIMLAPRRENVETVAKDVLLVLDRSGSMDGEKITQAKEAAKFILQHLNPDDRFALISFSSGIDSFSPELQPAEEAQNAVSWVEQQSAAGSTDINLALLEAAAISSRERPTYLIFLTDGLPTEGEIDSQIILQNFAASAPDNLRLFSFGVGYDVDTVLLDTLSQEYHGLPAYVKPGEALAEVLSGFYQRISSPVLTDLTLDFGNLATYDIYPSPLPDLFEGSQVIIVGRYRDGGSTTVTVKGNVNGVEKTYVYENQLFSVDNRGSSDTLTNLPRLWATRKIGYLLNQIRLKGADQETIDQIVRLSIRFGIVTPYTSYLVTEPSPLGSENQDRVAEETYRNMIGQPTAAPSGQIAVEKADAVGEYSQADAAITLSEETWQKVRIVGSRTFLLSNGIWMDTTFDPDTMVTQKIAFLSLDYFSLSNSRPEIAAAIALGERVIVVVDGNAYEVVGGDQIVPTLIVTPQPIATPIIGNTPLPTATTPQNENPQDFLCLGLLIPLILLLMAVVKR
jgi:Ca-activated chloride channel family protein